MTVSKLSLTPIVFGICMTASSIRNLLFRSEVWIPIPSAFVLAQATSIRWEFQSDFVPKHFRNLYGRKQTPFTNHSAVIFCTKCLRHCIDASDQRSLTSSSRQAQTAGFNLFYIVGNRFFNFFKLSWSTVGHAPPQFLFRGRRIILEQNLVGPGRLKLHTYTHYCSYNVLSISISCSNFVISLLINKTANSDRAIKNMTVYM